MKKRVALAPTKKSRRRVWIRQLLILLSVIGPGLITANVDNDATGITGYSLAGAQYGYSLLWAVVLVTVSLAIEQARVLVRYVRGHRLEVLLTLAVVTGMRCGELLALRWSDIDFDRRRLLVLRSVDYIVGYGYVEGKPKTTAGKRLISLPAFPLDMLKQHQIQQ